MDRQGVDASGIASIGYDESTATLEVEFLKGGLYQYYDVPEHVYNEFMSAGSHRSYLASNIKGTYSYSRVFWRLGSLILVS